MKPLPYLTAGIALTLSVSAQTPTELTWKNFDQIAEYVSLKKADENYQKVTWNDTVLKGHQLAQKADKPLLLWLYFGDPRANC